jgi:hypothetical protein
MYFCITVESVTSLYLVHVPILYSKCTIVGGWMTPLNFGASGYQCTVALQKRGGGFLIPGAGALKVPLQKSEWLA